MNGDGDLFVFKAPCGVILPLVKILRGGHLGVMDSNKVRAEAWRERNEQGWGEHGGLLLYLKNSERIRQVSISQVHAMTEPRTGKRHCTL